MSGMSYCSAFLLTVCGRVGEPFSFEPLSEREGKATVQTHVKGSVAVSADALVDREEAQIETVVVALVQEFHDIREHGRVCAQRTTISGGAEVAVTAEG